MRFRKFVVIPLLFLASALMLAFTVLPHHHHEAYICFVSTHCDGNHDNAPHNHDNQHTCPQYLLQARASKIQNLRHFCKKGHCIHFIQVFFCENELLISATPFSQKSKKNNIPYQEKLHNVWLLSSKAGRAPPAIG